MPPLDMNRIVGTHDIVMLTLDSLRYDVAQAFFEMGGLRQLSQFLPPTGWELRHSPGSFTFSTHMAVFAGFLPTPATPGPHPRLFAAEFEGSQTTTAETFVYDAPTWIEALRDRGYHSICIGGVGFFNKRTALSRVLPELFDESHWSPEMGVTSPTSTENQFALAARRLTEIPREERVLLFINVSATHQPNCIFGSQSADSCETQGVALGYVDSCLPRLVGALRRRGPAFCIVFSDHGTAYGEQGHRGHRLAHQVVWEVPYAEFLIDAAAEEVSQ